MTLNFQITRHRSFLVETTQIFFETTESFQRKEIDEGSTWFISKFFSVQLIENCFNWGSANQLGCENRIIRTTHFIDTVKNALAFRAKVFKLSLAQLPQTNQGKCIVACYKCKISFYAEFQLKLILISLGKNDYATIARVDGKSRVSMDTVIIFCHTA